MYGKEEEQQHYNNYNISWDTDTCMLPIAALYTLFYCLTTIPVNNWLITVTLSCGSCQLASVAAGCSVIHPDFRWLVCLQPTTGRWHCSPFEPGVCTVAFPLTVERAACDGKSTAAFHWLLWCTGTCLQATGSPGLSANIFCTLAGWK